MTRQSWESFAEAERALDRITPGTTTLEDLKRMGLDPFTSPNIKVLSYLDLMARLMPHSGFEKSDLRPEVQKCVETKDRCRAFELVMDVRKAKREGSAFLDLFGFKRTTHVTGWYLDAVLVLQDDVVIYKVHTGEPNVDRTQRKVRPLGPLQDLDQLLVPAAGKAM